MKQKQPAFLYGLNLETLRRLITAGIFAAFFLILTGCTTVKIYSDPGLKNESGLRYYTLRPYLLVEYNADKDKTVRTNVIYLPDLSNPQYLVFKTGFGSNDVKLTFSNSALTSYGVLSESMVSETLEAVASMLSKSAYAAQGFTGPGLTETDNSGIYFRLYEIIPGPDGTTIKEIVPLKKP